CDVVVSCNGEATIVSTGLIRPFASHIKAVDDQFKGGAHLIKLDPRECREFLDRQRLKNPLAAAAAEDQAEEDTLLGWFTLKTVERVVTFVKSPGLLEHAVTIEAELQSLDDTIHGSAASEPFQVEQQPDGSDGRAEEGLRGATPLRDRLSGRRASSRSPSPARSLNGFKTDASSDSGERESRLRQAKDVRAAMLKREQGVAIARAAAAGFSPDVLPLLLCFADCFGAVRLKHACVKFSSLVRRQDSAYAESLTRAQLAQSAAQLGGGASAGAAPQQQQAFGLAAGRGGGIWLPDGHVSGNTVTGTPGGYYPFVPLYNGAMPGGIPGAMGPGISPPTGNPVTYGLVGPNGEIYAVAGGSGGMGGMGGGIGATMGGATLGGTGSGGWGSAPGFAGYNSPFSTPGVWSGEDQSEWSTDDTNGRGGYGTGPAAYRGDSPAAARRRRPFKSKSASRLMPWQQRPWSAAGFAAGNAGAWTDLSDTSSAVIGRDDVTEPSVLFPGRNLIEDSSVASSVAENQLSCSASPLRPVNSRATSPRSSSPMSRATSQELRDFVAGLQRRGAKGEAGVGGSGAGREAAGGLDSAAAAVGMKSDGGALIRSGSRYGSASHISPIIRSQSAYHVRAESGGRGAGTGGGTGGGAGGAGEAGGAGGTGGVGEPVDILMVTASTPKKGSPWAGADEGRDYLGEVELRGGTTALNDRRLVPGELEMEIMAGWGGAEDEGEEDVMKGEAFRNSLEAGAGTGGGGGGGAAGGRGAGRGSGGVAEVRRTAGGRGSGGVAGAAGAAGASRERAGTGGAAGAAGAAGASRERAGKIVENDYPVLMRNKSPVRGGGTEASVGSGKGGDGPSQESLLVTSLECWKFSEYGKAAAGAAAGKAEQGAAKGEKDLDADFSWMQGGSSRDEGGLGVQQQQWQQQQQQEKEQLHQQKQQQEQENEQVASNKNMVQRRMWIKDVKSNEHENLPGMSAVKSTNAGAEELVLLPAGNALQPVMPSGGKGGKKGAEQAETGGEQNQEEYWKGERSRVGKENKLMQHSPLTHSSSASGVPNYAPGDAQLELDLRSGSFGDNDLGGWGLKFAQSASIKAAPGGSSPGGVWSRSVLGENNAYSELGLEGPFGVLEEVPVETRREATDEQVKLKDTRKKQEKEYIEMLRARDAARKAAAVEDSPVEKKRGSSLMKMFGFGF
ncbi:unnamed protein product, partial [Closterium sp. Naga37s-1]